MRKLDAGWITAGVVLVGGLAGCFQGGGDDASQQGGGQNMIPGAGTSGGGAGASGSGVGGGAIGGTGAGGTGLGGAGGGGCNGQIPAIARICSDGSTGEAVCKNGSYVFVCPEDGIDAGPATGGTGAGGACVAGGCSGQLCTDDPNTASTCEWRDEYACYQTATCARQADGQCGWTKTQELEACLGGGSGGFKWYATCGDPVCQVPPQPTGAPPCTTEVAGDSCKEGAPTCDPGAGCGANLICIDKDPQGGTFGCPISRRERKEGVEYVDAAERARFAQEIERMRLATYRYKADPSGRTHLGFIMEDVEPSMSADSRQGMVDLYGYMSMAVAALQEQRGEIDALKKQVKTLKRECR